MSSAPDKNLERYDIVDRIAVGGMAEVFRAKAYGAHGFEKTLAIKRILPELARDPEFEERFIVEAKLAVQLAHANIVQVFDFGRFGDSLFIAMEYVDGLDLAALLRAYRQRDQHISLGAALHISIEICKGLDFAHQRGVVHRDVSPSNVLLSRAGEVKLADFGIAQIEREHAESQTHTRRIMGKWRYMSPEQARGETLTPTSDLFSAAIMMYQLFTGEKLFPGEEAQEILDNIRDMKIPRASEARRDLPDGLDEVLLKALERDPAKRWQRAAEMQRALTELSYRRSIVASALDVEAAVSEVLGDMAAVPVTADAAPSGRRAIDELIRMQLGGLGAETMDSGTQRRTVAGVKVMLGNTPIDAEGATQEVGLLAGTGSATILRKGVDSDGVTMWELANTVAAAPSAIRGDRASAGHRALTDKRDTTTSRSQTGDAPAPEPAASRRGTLAAVAVAIAVLAALGGFLVFRDGGDKGRGRRTDPVVTPPVAPSDAAPVVAVSPIDASVTGTLRVTSDPPGAAIAIDGVGQGVTPADVAVAAGVPHTVELTLAGHRVWTEQGVQVGLDEVLRVPAHLEPLGAILDINTTPQGARVTLDGRVLGDTPLRRDDLPAGRGRKLVISLDDYERVTARVDLVAGEEVRIERELVAIPMGKVSLHFVDPGTFADVSFRGEVIVRGQTLYRARQIVSLPVGKQTIRFTNGSKTRDLEIEVRADRIKEYDLSFRDL